MYMKWNKVFLTAQYMYIHANFRPNIPGIPCIVILFISKALLGTTCAMIQDYSLFQFYAEGNLIFITSTFLYFTFPYLY